MKKALSLILVLVLCLSLCACGGGANERIQPQSNGENNITNSTIGSIGDIEDTTENTESIERDFADHPLLIKLFGTWENQNIDDEYAPYQILIINEDGSCNVDGVGAKWDVQRPYNPNNTSTLIIDIFIKGERTCGAILFSDGTITGQTSNHGIGGYYFNTSNSEQ